MGRGVLIPVIEVGCLPTSNPECRISGIVLLLCPLVELLLVCLLPLGAIVELLLATWAHKEPQEAHTTCSRRTASLHVTYSYIYIHIYCCPWRPRILMCLLPPGALVELLLLLYAILKS